MNSHRTKAIQASVFLFFFSLNAHGQVFGVLNCPSSPSFQEINFQFSSAATLLGNINSTVTNGLANNVNNEKYIFSSANVKSMSLNFSAFNMEQNYDYAYWGEKDSSYFLSMTGVLPTNTLVPAFVSKDFNQTPGSFRVTSDLNVASEGYNIDKVRVTCAAGAPGFVTPQLALGIFHLGVLLGSGDSIFFQIPSVSGQNTNLLLAGANTTDFDLFARCNAMPTKTVYTARSYSGDSNEFLSLPSNSCPNGVWYIVVNSFSGAGGFTLIPSRSFESENLTIRSYVQHVADSEVDNTANVLSLAARRIYATTLGGIVPVDIKVCGYFNFNCGTTNVTKRYDCNRSFADALRTPGTPIGHYALCTDGNGEIAAHEMGHTILGLPDEYQDVNSVSLARCGHTRMALSWLPSLCYSGDHNKDFQPGTTPNSFNISSWDRNPNSFIPSSMIPSKTPSVIDLQNHDFNNQIPISKFYSPYLLPTAQTRNNPHEKDLQDDHGRHHRNLLRLRLLQNRREDSRARHLTRKPPQPPSPSCRLGN